MSVEMGEMRLIPFGGHPGFEQVVLTRSPREGTRSEQGRSSSVVSRRAEGQCHRLSSEMRGAILVLASRG